MTSRCTVLTARPAGKQPLAAAQEAAGGRNRWNGVLPAQTLLARPKNHGTGPSLYPTIDAIQGPLRCWTGTCTTCGRPPPETSRTRPGT